MRALKLYFAGFFLIELLLHAGWPIWPLLGLSVLSLALILERIWYLRTSHIAPVDLLAPLLTQCRTALPTQQQSQDLKENSVLGGLLSSAIERVRQQPMISEAGLRQALEMEGRLACAQLEKHLPTLATIASLATLMGLLGTVIGMIDIFAAQSQTGQQPAQMAQGISMALYNTAFGLMVAIPSLLAWRWLRSRADQHIMQLEVACERLLMQLQSLQRSR
jgi:biopolymer transport protein ExbB